MPGLRLMAHALHQNTATLPHINSEELQKAVVSSPGKSTVEAMTLGVTSSLIGGVERIVNAYLKLAANEPMVFIGGGDASLFDGCFPALVCRNWPTMTLEGIRLAAEQGP